MILWPLLIVFVLIFSQAERLVRRGTFFGYRVRTVSAEQVTVRQNTNGSLLDLDKAVKDQKTIACDIFPEDQISKVVGAVKKIGSLIPDQKTPYLTSMCIYKTKDNGDFTSVSILLRKMATADAAKKAVETLKSGRAELIPRLGDAAIFNGSTNQLTVQKGESIITVTIPKKQQSEMDNKTAAIAIAKLGL